jgi:hypothetical protein
MGVAGADRTALPTEPISNHGGVRPSGTGCGAMRVMGLDATRPGGEPNRRFWRLRVHKTRKGRCLMRAIVGLEVASRSRSPSTNLFVVASGSNATKRL